MSNNIIDKIQLSGVTYDIGGSGGGSPTVELTQAEYDALVTAGTVSSNTYYIITDAEAGDLTNYYTKTETNTLLGGKQATLVSGTNIKTINNTSILGSGNIDIQGGGGGGKAIEAGRGISVTTGATADTVSFNLPISAGTGENSIVGNITQNTASGKNALALGGFYNSQSSYGLSVASGLGSVSFGGNASGEQSFAAASMASTASGQRSATIAGYSNKSKGVESLTSGRYVNAENMWECSFGYANASHKANNTWGDSGNTLFSVGNGTSTSARHNAFEIRQNGDIYLTKDGQDVKLQDQLGGGGSSYSAGTGIDITNDVISVTGMTAESAFTAHTANTDIHVTTAQTAAWNAKSDFSGSYNDLTNKLSAGTNITIVDNVISAEGGGKAIEAGTNISITTGETADTINCTLPIVLKGYHNNQMCFNHSVPHIETAATTSQNLMLPGERCSAMTYTVQSCVGGYRSLISGQRCFAFGSMSKAMNDGAVAFGMDNRNYKPQVASGISSFACGGGTSANTMYSFATGFHTFTSNDYEASFGQNNNSVSASTTFGDSGNTLFSVGNGTADNARHNAFEIRQNGDIYLTKDGQDVKLQDQLGGSSINVVQTTGTSTTDVMSQNAVSTKLSGYVTTDTDQVVTSRKTFTNSDKAIEFKQVDDNSKVGFKVKNSASTANELAAFELRPNTFTIDGVQHPLMYFGHYRNIYTANAGVPQTVIGFRQYDQKNAAAYHYLIPLPEKAKTPFNLRTSFKDYYAPMGFKNGSTMITADNTGVVDLSSELGGLKLKKLTQAEYDALATKDSNTLYVIVN